MKKVTVLGGGTGTFVVLSGLKKYALDLGVIVSMMDSGGSTGRLRDQLGVLPPGDLRQALVALSEAPLLWRELFLYRFESGDLEGHNFGNIFISALEKVSKDYDEVLKIASFVLKTKGSVIPVTYKRTHMVAVYADGKVIKGEGNIDTNHEERERIVKAYLEPKVEINSKAAWRLTETDCIVIGPGDLYTSIIPVLLVPKIKETIERSSAKVIYNMNLMTKNGQTSRYKASDHLSDLTKYLGRQPEVVIINTGQIPEGILEHYLKTDEVPVENDLRQINYRGKIIFGDLVDRKQVKTSAADKLSRSILRHDPEKLARSLYKLLI